MLDKTYMPSHFYFTSVCIPIDSVYFKCFISKCVLEHHVGASAVQSLSKEFLFLTFTVSFLKFCWNITTNIHVVGGGRISNMHIAQLQHLLKVSHHELVLPCL